MGFLANRIAKAQNTVTSGDYSYIPNNGYAFDSKAAKMQRYMELHCMAVNVKATTYDCASYVNRSHSGENAALVYIQWCVTFGFDYTNEEIESLQ